MIDIRAQLSISHFWRKGGEKGTELFSNIPTQKNKTGHGRSISAPFISKYISLNRKLTPGNLIILDAKQYLFADRETGVDRSCDRLFYAIY